MANILHKWFSWVGFVGIRGIYGLVSRNWTEAFWAFRFARRD